MSCERTAKGTPVRHTKNAPDRAPSAILGPDRSALARQIAEAVPDPELPMLTLADLGILREVTVAGDRVVVSITPTYSGCPAVAEIRADLHAQLVDAGVGEVQIRTVLTPPWSSEWISAAGRRKLAAAGIAPPASGPPAAAGPVPLTLTAAPGRAVRCPACDSADTERTAAFGATACKDLYRCRTCAEPFEHIKEI